MKNTIKNKKIFFIISFIILSHLSDVGCGRGKVSTFALEKLLNAKVSTFPLEKVFDAALGKHNISKIVSDFTSKSPKKFTGKMPTSPEIPDKMLKSSKMPESSGVKIDAKTAGMISAVGITGGAVLSSIPLVGNYLFSKDKTEEQKEGEKEVIENNKKNDIEDAEKKNTDKNADNKINANNTHHNKAAEFIKNHKFLAGIVAAALGAAHYAKDIKDYFLRKMHARKKENKEMQGKGLKIAK